MASLDRVLRWVRNTPLHPQWLLDPRTRTIQFILNHAAGRVLDVGASDRWVQSILPRGCSYIALDYPTTATHLYGTSPHVFADAGRLPFKDGAFDTVLMLEVLEHVATPEEALGEAYRVLTPGGYLLLTMPFLYPIHDAPHDYQRFTMHGLKRRLNEAGFELEALESTTRAVRAAGLLLNLALSGTMVAAIHRRSPTVVFLPLVVAAVPVVNLCAVVWEWLVPDWAAMSSGYRVVATRT